MEDDFAATTTIGERVAPVVVTRQPRFNEPKGPSFGIPSKLEPFCLLAKSARGASAANLINQVCAAPGVYVFSELLLLSSIKDLATNEQHASSYQLLETFAYGTWGDYVEKRSSLPPLNKAQETKLKQLTILTLAADHRVIPYSTLLSTLDLASIPDLEDLLIDAFYSGVLSGRLDQKEARLEVMSSLGRDVRATVPCPDPESMEVDLSSSTGGAAPSTESLTASLTAWLSTITNVLSSLDRHLATLAADAVNSVTAQEEHEIAVQIMVAEVESSSKSAKDKEKEKEKDPHSHSREQQGSGSSWKDSVGRLVGGAVGSSSGAVGGSSGKEEMDVDEKDSAGHDSARTPQSPSSGARQRKRGRT